MHRFHLNEFVVESELPLPCDASARSLAVEQAAQVLQVRRASLRELPCLMRHFKRQLSYDVGDGVLIVPEPFIQLHVNGRGDVITVDVPDAGLALAAAWIIGAALPICTLFRGGLPLHGAGAEVDGRFVGIMAPSGSGKSTLLWSLLAQGARFANDDSIPTSQSDGHIIAMPSVSGYPKLHQAALANSAVDVARCEPAPPHDNEFWVHLEASRRLCEPQPLAALFVLRPSLPRRFDQPEAHDGVVARRVASEVATPLLLRNLQGTWLLDKQMGAKYLAARCDTLARSVPLYALEYRKRFEVLPILARAIRALSEAPAQGAVTFHAAMDDPA